MDFRCFYESGTSYKRHPDCLPDRLRASEWRRGFWPPCKPPSLRTKWSNLLAICNDLPTIKSILFPWKCLNYDCLCLYDWLMIFFCWCKPAFVGRQACSSYHFLKNTWNPWMNNFSPSESLDRGLGGMRSKLSHRNRQIASYLAMTKGVGLALLILNWWKSTWNPWIEQMNNSHYRYYAFGKKHQLT